MLSSSSSMRLAPKVQGLRSMRSVRTAAISKTTVMRAAAKGAKKVAAPPPAEESVAGPAVIALAAPAVAIAGSALLIDNGSISPAAIEAYLHTTAGFVFDGYAAGSIPEFLVHWFHALNMGVVLFAMGGYGAWLGWQIRAGNGGDATFGTSDMVAELHPKLMGGMTLFFLAGGQGGLLFTLLEGKPLLETPHAVSAFAGLALLAANGVLGSVMADKAALRTTHAFLGSSLMLVFLVHAGLGIANGLSF